MKEKNVAFDVIILYATFGELECLIKCMNDDRIEMLIDRIVGGDTDAFQLVVQEYQTLVSHIVFRMIGNRSEREDLCQEVFIRIYRNLARFRFQAKFSTWIASIAYNACANHLKKKRLPLYDDDPHFSERRAGDSPLPDIRAEGLDMMQRLQEEMARLPAAHRAVLTLFHVDGYRYAEIGMITGLPEGTVKSYLFRGRKMLKDRLAQEVSCH